MRRSTLVTLSRLLAGGLLVASCVLLAGPSVTIPPVAYGAGPITYSSGALSQAIPDVTTTTNVITITDTGTIADINVQIRLNHTFDSDLDIFLIGPDSTTVELSTDNGAHLNNFGSGPSDCTGVFTTFDDAAATSITAGTAPFDGVFRPEGALSAFNGTSLNGNWTLQISDDVSGDDGTLFCWRLVVVTVDPPTPTPTHTSTSTVTSTPTATPSPTATATLTATPSPTATAALTTTTSPSTQSPSVTPTATETPTMVATVQAPTNTPTSTATVPTAPTPGEDSPRSKTAEQRQQEQHTNTSNLDQYHTEGNVAAVERSADGSTLFITVGLGRGETLVIEYRCPPSGCPEIRMGAYVLADGEQGGGDVGGRFIAEQIEISP